MPLELDSETQSIRVKPRMTLITRNTGPQRESLTPPATPPAVPPVSLSLGFTFLKTEIVTHLRT